MAQVELIFRGEVLDGFAADDVRRVLAERLKLDEPRLARLFTGKPVVIKRGLSAAVAQQWVAQFRAMGARLHARDEKPAAPPTPTPQPALHPAPPPAPALALVPSSAPPAEPAGLALVPLARDPHAAPAPTPIPPSATHAAAAGGETITCPVCGEEQPKRILCRACAADMPRGIAAKEEEAAAERARRQAAWAARRGGRPGSAADRGRTRRVQTLPGAGADGDDVPLFGLGFDGRIGRMRYFLGLLLFLLGLFWGVILLTLIPGFMTALLLLVGLALAVVWNLRLTVLRLHDVGLRGGWVLASYIPWVGQIGSLVLMLWPGQAEANDHGEPPSQDGEGAKAAVAALVALSLSVGWGFKTAVKAFEDKVAEMQAEAGEDDGLLEGDDEPGAEAALPPPGELKRVLRSDLAVDEFRRYMAAPGHRAFTVSDGGAWGWHSGAARPNQAVDTAMADCERRRKPYTPECRVVHVNNDWAMP